MNRGQKVGTGIAITGYIIYYLLWLSTHWHVGHVEADAATAVARRLGTLVGGML